MKKSTSIILAAAIAAAAVLPTTALISAEPSTPAASSAALEWWEYPRHTAEPAVQAWMTDTEVRLSAGVGPGLPQDAKYRWLVDGARTGPLASLPAEPLKLQRDAKSHQVQAVFLYELGGEQVVTKSDAYMVPALGE